jgi:predicted DNA-binding protein (UPF0251 family)
VPLRELEVVELTLEEIEAIRLRHINNLEQSQAAKEMNTSQSTYQEYYIRLMKKLLTL